MNSWEMWEKNFNNARAFFKSEGNTKTISALKAKWYKEFCKDLEAMQ